MRLLPLAGIMVLSACGGEHPAEDGGSTDAQRVPGLVTVGVTRAGSAQSGVPVYFQAADSSLVGSALTDGGGSASAEMPVGGFVTAIDRGSDEIALITYADVSGGQHLQISLGGPPPPSDIHVMVTIPTDPGAARYFFETQCGEMTLGSGVNSTLIEGCPMTDVLLTAVDANNNALRTSFTPNVAFADGSAVTITAPYETPTTAVASFSDAPEKGGSDFVFISQGWQAPNGFLFAQGNGGTLADGSGTVKLLLPPEAGPLVETDSTLRDDVTVQTVEDWGAPAATHALDVDQEILGELTSDPVLDLAQHRVTWTPPAHGGVPNLTAFTFDILDVDGSFVEWDIASSAVDGTLSFPNLPLSAIDLSGATANMSRLFLLRVPGLDPQQRAQLLGGQFDGDRLALADATAGDRVVISVRDDEQPIRSGAPRGRRMRFDRRGARGIGR